MLNDGVCVCTYIHTYIHQGEMGVTGFGRKYILK